MCDEEVIYKTCTGCGKSKPLDSYSLHSKGKFGRNTRCKECKNSEASRFYVENRDHILERQKDARKASYRMKTYGLPDKEYQRMYNEQGGKCLLCENYMEVLCVDHCHTTLKVRGLLCRPCNFGLGHFKDNPNVLRKAADYLEK